MRAWIRTVVVLVLAVSACLHRSDLRSVTLSEPPAADSLGVWGEYYQFLDEIAHGARYDQWQLKKTVDYFTSVTSIETRLDMSGLGYTLDVHALRADLRDWGEWHKTHALAALSDE